MIKEVIYNPDYIETVHSLSNISEQLLFLKETDEETGKENVVLRIRTDSIIYTMEAPLEYFDFKSNSLAFFDFNKFYNLYRFSVTTNANKELVAPSIKAEIDDDEGSFSNGELTRLIIGSTRGSNSRTINHRTTSPDTIEKPRFTKVKFVNNTNCTFTLDKEKLETLKKMASLNSADEIIFSGENDTLNVDFRSSKFMDTINESYKTDCNASPFSLTFVSDGLQKVPNGDYTTEYMINGMIRLHQIRNDEINLNIYLPRKKV